MSKKNLTKKRKELYDLMHDAKLDGRTNRPSKEKQFGDMKTNIEEYERIEKQIMELDKNEAWTRQNTGKESEVSSFNQEIDLEAQLHKSKAELEELIANLSTKRKGKTDKVRNDWLTTLVRAQEELTRNYNNSFALEQF